MPQDKIMAHIGLLKIFLSTCFSSVPAAVSFRKVVRRLSTRFGHAWTRFFASLGLGRMVEDLEMGVTHNQSGTRGSWRLSECLAEVHNLKSVFGDGCIVRMPRTAISWFDWPRQAHCLPCQLEVPS